MNDPKISIITITYNSEKTVRSTFESIRKQNYDNLEYIVIDGGSTDSTLDIAKEYSDIISTIVSEPDNGISDAMNKGIRLATGDLIGIIHSDDMLSDGALNKLSKQWDGKTDIYYGDLLVCDSDGRLMHKLVAKRNLERMPYYVDMSHPSTFITNRAYKKYGLYNVKYKCVMDNDLLIRYKKQGAIFKYISYPLAIYRIGGTNMKMRKITIKESRDISIKYGGSVIKSYVIWIKKNSIDYIKKWLPNKSLVNRRIKKAK